MMKKARGETLQRKNMNRLRIEFAPLPARATRPDAQSMRAIFGGCIATGQQCRFSNECCYSKDTCPQGYCGYYPVGGSGGGGIA
jgi:hypothetical protein